MTGTVRIDKWLWAVRIFKTRTIASEECKKGRVCMDSQPLKPSHIVRVGDTITVRKPPATYTFKITGLIENRVAAKIAVQQYENLTPVEEYEHLQALRMATNFQRDPGAGRPTKKDRRLIDKIQHPD